MTHKRLSHVLILFVVLAMLSACQANQPKSQITATAESQATQTPGRQTEAPAPTEAPTSIAQNTPTQAAGSYATITLENAPNLVPLIASFTLPHWPQNLIWPNEAVDLTDISKDRPAFLAFGEDALDPISLSQLSIGPSYEIPLAGSRVVSIAPDGSSMVVQNDTRAWISTIQGRELWTLPKTEQLYGATYSSDSRYLAIMNAQNIAVTIYDVSAGKDITTLTGFETAAPVYSAVVAPGGDRVAWYARATLQFQDIASGTLTNQLHFEEFIQAIEFSPDHQHIIVCAGSQLMVINSATAEITSQLTLSEPLRSLSISPDGQILAAAMADKLQLWEAKTLVPISAIHAPANMNMIRFSPEGNYLVSTSEEKNIIIWKTP
jgi:hypothetical protein